MRTLSNNMQILAAKPKTTFEGAELTTNVGMDS
jgi:hypothetical protein